MLKIDQMETDKYNIDITAVQDTWWKKSGELINQFTFLYSGEGKKGSNGVGFYAKKNLRNNILRFILVNGKTTVLRLRTKKPQSQLLMC